MDNLYINILEFLAKNGINKTTDISGLFDDFSLQPKEPGDLLVNGLRNRLINIFLNRMTDDGFIVYENLTVIPSTNIVPWIFPIHIEAQITSRG